MSHASTTAFTVLETNALTIPVTSAEPTDRAAVQAVVEEAGCQAT